MINKFQLLQKRTFKFSNSLESNPQLFREIKGKINGKNIFITALISILTQLFIIVGYLGKLPDIGETGLQYSRYCMGKVTKYKSVPNLCIEQADNWQISWELFWHDIFIFLSFLSIFILLICGTYMIIADLSQEKKVGTLNFIRLSPQSANQILLGKILGVPILIYFFIASLLPLLFVSSFKANISWYLTFLFSVVVLTSCAFFYSLSLLLSLIKIGRVKFNPWIATIIIILLLLITTSNIYLKGSFREYFVLFSPITVLGYLSDVMPFDIKIEYYTDINSLSSLLFYGQPILSKASTGMTFITLHFCFWTYWFWQGATRLFYNPNTTIISKKQSYWLTGCFMLVALGFMVQHTRQDIFSQDLIIMQLLLLLFFLSLIAALSPHRQTLYDWARYRHQSNKEKKALWRELVFGDKSPSTIAILINISIATTITIIELLLYSLKPEVSRYVIWTLVMTMSISLLYAIIAQWMLLMKSSRRLLWTSVTIASLISIPLILSPLVNARPYNAPLLWLFSFLPVVGVEYASTSTLIIGVLGQWLVIVAVSIGLIRKLRAAGRSETQKLLAK